MTWLHGFWAAAFCILIPWFLGCQSGQGAEKSADGTHVKADSSCSAESRVATGVSGVNVSAHSPKQVVSRFLAALRKGDRTTAASLLSRKAKAETAKHNLAIRPKRNSSATCEIGRVVYQNAETDHARVHSTWTEAAEDGSPEIYEITWVLRRRAKEWRVTGMETLIRGSDQPVLLDFENARDMLRKCAGIEDKAQDEDHAALQPSR